MLEKLEVGDNKAFTVDNHYEKSDILEVGIFMEMFNQLLYEALCEQGGCDGTDKLTNQLSVNFNNNESSKVMDFLKLNFVRCDCDAYRYMHQYISTLYPPPISPTFHFINPFCDEIKKRWYL